MIIKCKDKHNRKCRGFREELHVTDGGKKFCVFEFEGYCGADKSDFRVKPVCNKCSYWNPDASSYYRCKVPGSCPALD